MKSIEIINYIDSLNEDAYSKFTVKQLYTKLGKEGLVTYVKKVVESILPRLGTEFKNPISNVINLSDTSIVRCKVVKPDIDFFDMFSVQIDVDTSIELVVKYWFGNEKEGSLSGSSSQFSIEESTIDLSSKLSKIINLFVSNNEVKKRRESYINGLRLKSQPVSVNDYHKFSLKDIYGRSSEMLRYISDLAECIHIILLKAIPAPEVMWLRKRKPVVSKVTSNEDDVIYNSNNMKKPSLGKYVYDETLKFTIFDEVPAIHVTYKVLVGILENGNLTKVFTASNNSSVNPKVKNFVKELMTSIKFAYKNQYNDDRDERVREQMKLIRNNKVPKIL